MKKLVIANKGISGTGKSSSIKAVFGLLKKCYPNDIDIRENKGDVKALVEIKGVKIGIESQGDPYSRMTKSIDEFVNENCSIIVVACRTKGDTYNKIFDLEKQGYEVIWASNDRTNIDVLMEYLNDIYAERVVKIIEDKINLE